MKIELEDISWRFVFGSFARDHFQSVDLKCGSGAFGNVSTPCSSICVFYFDRGYPAGLKIVLYLELVNRLTFRCLR